MALLNDELEDRFAEVEIETSKLDRQRELFEKNEKTIADLEENRQNIQSEYDSLKAEEGELDDRLEKQLKSIGKETYKPIKLLSMSIIVYKQKADTEAEINLLQTTSNDLEAEIDVSGKLK